MSRLVKETEDEIYLTRYLHDEPDSYADWEIGEDGQYGTRFSEKVHEAEHYVAYELKLSYKINKKTAEVTLLGIE